MQFPVLRLERRGPRRRIAEEGRAPLAVLIVPLKGGEEEQPVVLDGPAEAPTHEVTREIRLVDPRRLVEVAAVEPVLADAGHEAAALPLVRSRFRGGRDDRA